MIFRKDHWHHTEVQSKPTGDLESAYHPGTTELLSSQLTMLGSSHELSSEDSSKAYCFGSPRHLTFSVSVKVGVQ